jgi:predicted NBD/HSP70 family sugar kinase
VVASSPLQPADLLSVRRNNLALVLRMLHDDGPRSRAAVAAETGLNKATVSRLVAELIGRGLVRELGLADQRGRGRPATLIDVDGRRVAALGLELNVDFITSIAIDLAGRRIFEKTRAIDAAGAPRHQTLRALTSVIRQTIAAVAPTCSTIAGVTVAVPGLVDVEAGAITFAPNLHWWNVEVGRRVAGSIDPSVSVTVDNDANLGAFAEYRVGEFAGTPNLIYITGETGVGGGIIVDGRLLRGATGFSGEVGHMHIVDGGPACGCGRFGCWEALVGLRPLLREAVPDVLEQLDAHPRVGPAEKVAHVVERAEAGDPRVLAALERHGRWLGTGLATLVNLFNPQVVVLGGFFRAIAPWVLDVAERTMGEYSIAPDAGGCRLAVSELGFSAAAVGAAIHAAERVFDDPAIVAVAEPAVLSR